MKLNFILDFYTIGTKFARSRAFCLKYDIKFYGKKNFTCSISYSNVSQGFEVFEVQKLVFKNSIFFPGMKTAINITDTLCELEFLMIDTIILNHDLYFLMEKSIMELKNH